METNKLLTLEEIEGMEASVDSFDAKTKAFFARKGVTLNALLATARAYWELKHQVSISSKEGMRKKLFNDSVLPLYEKPARLPELADDKPHAPTIRAIVEAIKVGANANSEFNAIWAIIKSLEKHLE